MITFLLYNRCFILYIYIFKKIYRNIPKNSFYISPTDHYVLVLCFIHIATIKIVNKIICFLPLFYFSNIKSSQKKIHYTHSNTSKGTCMS